MATKLVGNYLHLNANNSFVTTIGLCPPHTCLVALPINIPHVRANHIMSTLQTGLLAAMESVYPGKIQSTSPTHQRAWTIHIT